MHLIIIISVIVTTSAGILFPYSSDTREVLSLDGIWQFRTGQPNKPNAGFEQGWFLKNLEQTIPMPVPSSFNDITTSPTLRDYEGWVWYQRKFYAPAGWKTERIFIRFGSVQYIAEVYLNGKFMGKHTGGHLPFKVEISDVIKFGEENLLTVAVNNTLTRTTIPQGSIIHTNNTDRYPTDYVLYDHEYRYFNYAGIHRSVYLYTVPQTHVDDISIVTDITGTTGIVNYKIKLNGPDIASAFVLAILIDDENNVVASCKGMQGSLIVSNAIFWWPRLSHPTPAHLYTLQVSLTLPNFEDRYSLPVGIRTLSWNATTFLLNDKPVYLRGFGKHEDYDVIGRGLDMATLVRDFNLIGWLGANAFRTSHYPYSEELMDLADRHGYMVIVEAPACTIKFFSPRLLEAHKRVVKEMIQRDKNRPSVIMWSLANEPYSDNLKAENYFGTLVNLTKQLDSTRPVTFVTSRTPQQDKAAHLVDIICMNRYPAWYDDGGKTQLVKHQVLAELLQWYRMYNKTVIVTEYGAASVPGLHMLPASMWSEEYHVEVLRQHFLAFDTLRQRPLVVNDQNHSFLVGEMTWNFADFATQQEIIRPGFCMKGLFTRQRQPKMAAHIARNRYWQLARELSPYVQLPTDMVYSIA